MLSMLSMGAWAQAQWMNGLNDNIYISQLSLPGAHDAATKSLSIGKCQDKDIAGLWDAGVRVFDLRPTDSGDDCTINHGSLSTGVTLKAALTTINGRLSSYSTEFAIVLMRKEDGGDTWASKVKAVFDQFSNVMPFSQNLRLCDVRGKILVLSRDYFADGYKIDYWGDNTTRDVRSANGIAFVVQDYYKVEDTDAKSTAIANILAEARANNSTNRMFINHTSGYVPGLIPGLSDDITGNASTCNTLALNTINANPGPTGIILMDYAGSSSYNGANLVSKIIAQNNLLAATWTAPAAPGEDLLALSESTDVFVYNIEADAIFSRGFNWLTMAIADRPEGGDNAVPANRQRVQIRRDGSNIKIHWNDRGSDQFFGQADNTDAGSMWTDLGNAGNRSLFTPAFSSNYPNAYTLTNVQHNKNVDVLWGRGGKLTLWNGKGFYDWVFLSGDAFTSGKLAKFKVRKAMWNLYQALEKAGAVAANAAALNTAYAVYTNDNASTDDLRAAFRTMFLAVAGSIEDPVDVSYIFTHPDMSGDKTAAGWSYSDFAFSAGECEKYHAAFTSTQTITDAPNGLYDVTMTGIYRQDDGQNQAAPQLIVSNSTTEMTGDFPNMDLMGGKWNIGGDPTGDWVNSSTGKMPKWMWSASDAQAHDEAGVKIENVKVEDNILGITFKVTGGNQWFNFQRVFITYKGSVNVGLYKSLQDKIAEANDYITANTGVIPASFLTAISNAVSAASSLTANSTELALTNAIDAINVALTAANAAPSIAKLNELQNLITLAQADGINTTAAEAVVANPTTLIAVNEQIDILTNARILAATIALAKAEGVNTSAAEAVIVANPLAANAINSALNDVRTARRLNAVDKQPDIFTGTAPEDGGQYYIYNIGAQRYLTGGVNYGTHAAVNFAAQIATFTQNGDGWRIHTNIRTNSDALNHNGYVDCGGDGDTWYLIEVSTGVYNISQTNSNTGATLLGYSGERRGNWWQVDTDNQGADQTINQWKLVSKAERDALMANASETNPVDATYYIHAAGFDHHLPSAQLAFPLTQWQTWFPEGKGGNNGIGGWEPDFNWESWNSGNIKFYQELTGLTPGKYRLTAQAYYRHGNFEQAVSEFNNPKTDGAILYATNGNGVTAQTYIVPITSEVNKVPGYGRSSSIGSFPDDRNETAAQFFEAGLYKNVVNDIVVTADGTLTIGVEKFENSQGAEWVVADNFRLTYLGVDDVVVGAAGYTTFVAPYNIAVIPEGVEAYACQVGTSSVHLEPVEAIPAGEAVVLKNAGTYTFRPTTSEVELGTTNDLLPSDGTITGAAGNIYALANKSNGVGFYPVGSDVTVPAGKGYLQIPNSVKAFYGFDEDDATSINEELRMKSEESSIYNVAGQRLNKVQKGINILNRKKILK